MALPAYSMNQASFPALYERVLVGAMFRPFAEILLDRLAFEPGDRLIDVACGTGIVARCASERAGRSMDIVGIDISAPMLSIARSIAPNIDWREGQASSLPLSENERFTVLTCHQGFQFFTDKASAAREFRRVLQDGGRVGVATWRPAHENRCFAVLQEIAEQHLGEVSDQRFAFGDIDAVKAIMTGASFHDVRGEVVSQRVAIREGAVFVRMNTMALIGMSPKAAERSDEERMRLVETITNASLDAAEPYIRDGTLECEMSTALVTARA